MAKKTKRTKAKKPFKKLPVRQLIEHPEEAQKGAYPVLEAPTPHFNTNDEIKAMVGIYGAKIMNMARDMSAPNYSLSQIQNDTTVWCNRILQLVAQLSHKKDFP